MEPRADLHLHTTYSDGALSPYELIKKAKGAGSLKELTVPAGHCFVLGDNLPVSWDSRAFGWLPVGAILGRVSL